MYALCLGRGAQTRVGGMYDLLHKDVCMNVPWRGSLVCHISLSILWHLHKQLKKCHFLLKQSFASCACCIFVQYAHNHILHMHHRNSVWSSAVHQGLAKWAAHAMWGGSGWFESGDCAGGDVERFPANHPGNHKTFHAKTFFPAAFPRRNFDVNMRNKLIASDTHLWGNTTYVNALPT